MIPTNLEDTIAAIATPPGEGGIGIVRVSGPNAIALVASCFYSSTGRVLTGAGRVFHGEIRDGERPLDEVLAHVMRGPHSYTREDVVEVNGHGGAAPLNAVLELLLRRGARLAQPGEFTKRAFLNGRIDLVQAEAVIDRIRAQTKAGLAAAAAAASGVLSRTLGEIRDDLISLKAQFEAAVDFVDQELPELLTPELKHSVENTLTRMRDLYATADTGRLYREGAAVALVGRPNVGKSSLFNALLRDARAIVTATAGTTRDLLEETITIEGVPVKLFDMAGVRETADEVERLGVEAARKALQRAVAALFIVDSTAGMTEGDAELLREIEGLEIPCVFVANKIDLAPAIQAPESAALREAVAVSAQTAEGLSALEAALGRIVLGGDAPSFDSGMLNRLHQKESLRRAIEAVERLIANYDTSPEFLALELDEALKAVGEITGETTPDDVLERIFGAFCIGK